MEKDPFADLTWEDLEDWAGTTIVSRGRTYQRNSSVSDLGITPEGTLIAYVLGRHALCHASGNPGWRLDL